MSLLAPPRKNPLTDDARRINRNALLMDSAPVGAVGLPGGLLGMQPPQERRPNYLQAGLLAGSFAPGLGDGLGLLSDAYMYANEPESRTPMNYAMSALGLLPFIPAATVFHGSPHKFDAFDMSKIGTGEGAQAYGHGLYFADAPEVARNYQPSGLTIDVDMKNIPVSMDNGNSAAYTAILENKGDIAAAKNSLLKQIEILKREAGKYLKLGKPDDAEAFLQKAKWREQGAQLIDEGRYKVAGNSSAFYTVDLPDEAIAKMLDWDKPLSEQPRNVRNVIRNVVDKVYGDGFFDEWAKNGANVSDLYKNLDDFNPDEISDALKAAGIPGIRYLDGGSRGSGKGTYNYVVFDDKLPKILKRE